MVDLSKLSEEEIEEYSNKFVNETLPALSKIVLRELFTRMGIEENNLTQNDAEGIGADFSGEEVILLIRTVTALADQLNVQALRLASTVCNDKSLDDYKMLENIITDLAVETLSDARSAHIDKFIKVEQ